MCVCASGNNHGKLGYHTVSPCLDLSPCCISSPLIHNLTRDHTIQTPLGERQARSNIRLRISDTNLYANTHISAWILYSQAKAVQKLFFLKEDLETIKFVLSERSSSMGHIKKTGDIAHISYYTCFHKNCGGHKT